MNMQIESQRWGLSFLRMMLDGISNTDDASQLVGW